MLDVKIGKVLYLKRTTVREGSPTHQWASRRNRKAYDIYTIQIKVLTT